MKKCRFFLVITLVILLLVTLVGCVKNDVTVLVSYTKDSVTVYTDKLCLLDLTIKIKDGEKTDTVTKTFEFNKGNETINLVIDDFVSGYYDENAIISEVHYGQPKRTADEEFILFIVIIILVMIVVMIITAVVLAILVKKRNKYLQNQTDNLK